MNNFPPVEVMVQGLAFWDKAIDGEEINTATVYVMEDMDLSNPNLAGRRTVDYKADEAALVKPTIAAVKEGRLTFPLKARMQLAVITGKNTQKLRVISFEVVQAPAVQKAA
jgi:hypothetical protein